MFFKGRKRGGERLTRLWEREGEGEGEWGGKLGCCGWLETGRKGRGKARRKVGWGGKRKEGKEGDWEGCG